jgi:hypothetical protein
MEQDNERFMSDRFISACWNGDEWLSGLLLSRWQD